MIGILAFMKRKRADATDKGAAATEKPPQPKKGKPTRFMGGSFEKTQDLLVGHDGERVGFRKPVQG